MKQDHILFVLMLCCTLIGACSQQRAEQTTVKLPELRTRPQVIGPEGEMASMLEQYDQLAARIKSNPQDASARLSLIELFMQEARISGEHGYYYPAALEMVDRVLTMNLQPIDRYRALLDKASILLSQHQFAGAKQIAEEALAIHAGEAAVYGVLVDAHVELGNYEKAVEMADKMVAIRPDIRSYSRVSYLREIHGQVNGAIEAMKLAVSAGYPGMEQTEWARLILGKLYQKYGDPDTAAMHYQRALSARPNYPFALAALAEVQAEKGNLEEALSLNQQACSLIPEVGFFVNQAKWLNTTGKKDEAKALTKEILDMLADDVRSGHQMGLEYVEVYLDLLQDPEAALKHAETEYQARPNNIDVNQAMARVYLAKGDSEKARSYLAAATRTHSQNPELLALIK